MTGAWRAGTKANLGRALEELVQLACRQYRVRGEAVIHKVPTAFLPIRSGPLGARSVVGVKVEEQAAVDFLGVDRHGRAIAFDTKQSSDERWDLRHLRTHQAEFLADWHALGGVAFVLVGFWRDDAYYVLPWPELEARLRAWRSGGPASVSLRELAESRPTLRSGGRVALDFLAEVDRLWPACEKRQAR